MICNKCKKEIFGEDFALIEEETVKVMGDKLEEKKFHYLHKDCFSSLYQYLVDENKIKH